jgi:hypothetical protein
VDHKIYICFFLGPLLHVNLLKGKWSKPKATKKKGEGGWINVTLHKLKWIFFFKKNRSPTFFWWIFSYNDVEIDSNTNQCCDNDGTVHIFFSYFVCRNIVVQIFKEISEKQA